MVDLNNEEFRGRFHKALQDNYKLMEPFRAKRRAYIAEFAGSSYGDDGDARNETFVNLIQQMVELITFGLVAQRPQYNCSTDQRHLKPMAARTKLAVNRLVKEINLEETLRDAVQDACFMLGIVKTAPALSGAGNLGDQWVTLTEPNSARISFDNYVVDMTAKDWRRIAFEGDIYEVSKEALAQDDRFDPEIVKQISERNLNAEREPQGGDPASTLSAGAMPEDAELFPKVELIDVYFPETNQVCTLVWGQPDIPPLAIEDWVGRKEGPYRKLGFVRVPDNLIPAGLVGTVKRLHDWHNSQLRKIVRSSNNSKSVYTFADSAAEDAERIRTANDGEFIRVQDPNGVTTLTHPGPNQADVLLAQQTRNDFDRMGGNVQAMGGLGVQSGTVGQEKLIHGAVDRAEQRRGYLVTKFAAEIGTDLAYLLWNNPTKEYRQFVKLKHSKKMVPADWTANLRLGEFDDYEFDLEPYSLPFQAPADKMASITNALTQLLTPEFVQSQGGAFDLQALVDLLADTLNAPQLRDIVRFAAAPTVPMSNNLEGGMPANTTRTYERISRQGAPAAEAQAAQLMQAMASSEADNRSEG